MTNPEKRRPEPYPPSRADDSVQGPAESTDESRSFEPKPKTPPLADHDRLGPAGDPAEGKR